MTDGKTQLVGLIGWPVEHSLSPLMHNAAFRALGLNWHYVPLPVHPGQVRLAVQGLGALGFRGVNVTVPHKQAVITGMDTIASRTRVLGAINTIVIEHRRNGGVGFKGYNTDYEGFIGALREGGFDPNSGGKAVVVGAGGSSRAVTFGLLWSGIAEIIVINRTLKRAKRLVSDLRSNAEASTQVQALPLNAETLVETACTADLLVNTTTIGMWPHVEVSIWPDSAPIPAHLTVFDLVYNPLETRLLQQAKRAGARAIDGLGMLIRQGAVSFEMWTGKSTVGEIAALMRPVCESTLRGKIAGNGT